MITGQTRSSSWSRMFLSLVVAVLLVSWMGGAAAFAAEAASGVPDVVARTTPSVVAIIGKPTSSEDKSWEKNRYNLAHGTGVIYQANGVIITNAHVVKDMKNIVVVTSDGKSYSGRTTNIDEESDLALVKIEASGLPTAKLAESGDIKVGEAVAAIGTPISFALRNSVTTGIVSGLDRAVNSQYQLIQTDAAINPGNSGGALVNMKGEVIGINTMKYADFGVENLGFAIPIDTVKYVLRHFELYGKVKRPYLGLELEESWEAVVGLPSTEGLQVAYVEPDSPAAKAGIKQGDTLEMLGSSSTRTLVDYNEAMKKYLPGETVGLTLKSNGATLTTQITLGEAESKEADLSSEDDGSSLDADRGKTRIGDSHFGWSMKYPAGLVKSSQSGDGDEVSFIDAKGEFMLTVSVASNQSKLTPSALLNKIAADNNDYDGKMVLERQYVKDDQPYAKIVSKSGDSYKQTRGYQQDGKLYTVALNVDKESYGSSLKQNILMDLLDSFQLKFDGSDESLKDISLFSDGNTTYTDEYGVSLDLPAGWERDSYGTDSMYANDDYTQSVWVQVTSASSGDTLDAWVKRDLKQVADSYVSKYLKVGEIEELTLAGVPARMVEVSHTMGDSKWSTSVGFYFIKDKYKYAIAVSYADEDKDGIESVIDALKSTVSIDKEHVDAELGFIQDMDELLDPNSTISYVNKTYGYSLAVPETWMSGYSYGDKDQASKVFYFTGGSLTVSADEDQSFEDAVKEEDAFETKSHNNDKDYTYTADDVELFDGVKAKKYVVHYSDDKIPYQSTIYIFNHGGVSYNVKLNIDDAVKTEANEARLNKTFESLAFVNQD